MTREVKQWWEATAEYFQAESDVTVGVHWNWPNDFDPQILADVESCDVLELGCGGGQLGIGLAKRGANVTGIDLSAEQLAHARTLAAEHDVDVAFCQGDITDLRMFEDERFDVACNAWVFQWVDDLAAVFEETNRVLRPDGRFVFSMPHPYYEIVDADSQVVTESYFDTGRYVIESEGVAVDQVMYRHKVSEVYNDLVDAGFDVERLHEPGTDDSDAYEEGPWGTRTPELMSKVPNVLVVEARKQG
jgi:SAM-dependent methyltransferase